MRSSEGEGEINRLRDGMTRNKGASSPDAFPKPSSGRHLICERGRRFETEEIITLFVVIFSLHSLLSVTFVHGRVLLPQFSYFPRRPRRPLTISFSDHH